MDFKDLECFLALKHELHFTRAAERMNLAQPPFSQRIKGLEEKLGARLFDRNSKMVVPTKAGETFAPLAQQILNMTRSAVELTRQVDKGLSGRIEMGAIYSCVYTVIPALLRTFAAQHPHVTIDVEEMAGVDQIAELRKGTIDAGLLRTTQSDPDIATLLLYHETCVAAVGTSHPLASRESLSLRQIASERFITFEQSTSPEFDTLMFTAFARNGLAPKQVRRVRSMHMILGLVSAGVGVAIVPSTVGNLGLGQVRFIPISDPLPTLDIRLAWLASGAPPIVLRMAEVIRDWTWTPSPYFSNILTPSA